MPAKSQKNDQKNGHDDEENEREPLYDAPLDTSEVLPEEVPAELLGWIEGLHAHVVWCSTQYEVASKQWRMSRTKLNTITPPEQTAHELALWYVAEMRRHHDSTKTGDPPERYRAVAGVLFPGNKTPVQRTTTLGVTYDVDGTVQFVDLRAIEGAERSAKDTAAHGFKQATEIALRCLNGVAVATEKITEIGDAVSKMAVGTAELARHSGDGLAKVIEAQGKIHQQGMEHEEDMERLRQLGAIGQQVAGPLAQAFATYMATRGAAAAGGEPLHDRFSTFVEEAGGRWTKLLEELTPDERRMLSELYRATSDQVFLAVFAKLQASWSEGRLGQVLPLVQKHLGEDLAERLALLVNEASQKAQAA